MGQKSGENGNGWRSNFPAFGVNVNVNDIIARLHLFWGRCGFFGKITAQKGAGKWKTQSRRGAKINESPESQALKLA